MLKLNFVNAAEKLYKIADLQVERSDVKVLDEFLCNQSSEYTNLSKPIIYSFAINKMLHIPKNLPKLMSIYDEYNAINNGYKSEATSLTKYKKELYALRDLKIVLPEYKTFDPNPPHIEIHMPQIELKIKEQKQLSNLKSSESILHHFNQKNTEIVDEVNDTIEKYKNDIQTYQYFN